MAVPQLAEDPPFYEFNPGSLPVQAAEAASRERAVKVARRVGPGQMRPVDMAVCGSVAVNRGTGKNHAMNTASVSTLLNTARRTG
jgi:5-formyltetrahydrofolate cyclo-ligase